MANETFLVTGSTGCIGSWVLRLLVTEGVRVIAAHSREDFHRPRLLMSPDELERIKTLPRNDPDLSPGIHIDAANPIEGVYARTWTVTDDAPMADMKRVDVLVGYSENGIPRSIQLTTYLAP